MFSLQDLYNEIDKYAPFSLSEKLISQGDYDNSGIIVETHDEVKKVLFALDLNLQAVKRAKKLKCDTIVTHHPAIYTPIKSIRTSSLGTNCLVDAIKNNMNVVSVHLNLDVTEEGIDYFLAKGLGAKKSKILSVLQGKCGYGRQFEVDQQSLGDFVKHIKKEFDTNKITVYGDLKKSIRTVASFCGAGAGYVQSEVQKDSSLSDVIVTSDMPHHIIKELVESQKSIILLTHYSSEIYGFNRFFEHIKKVIENKAQCEFFSDLRFK